MRTIPKWIATGLLLLAAPLSASAETAGGKACDSFLWPLDTEIAWFKADDSQKLASGATLAGVPADKAIALNLLPTPKVELPAKPTSTPKADDAEKFSGFVTIEAFPEPGTYQVAISTSGWLDVVQNGTALEAIAHTGAPQCDLLRKSVRFEIGPGPVSIQVSGVPRDSIKIAVRPAAD